jgi:hypothetical protein
VNRSYQKRCHRDATDEPRGLTKMGRSAGHPNENRAREREDEEPDRQAADEAEARKEARHDPEQEPREPSPANFVAVPPHQDGSDCDEDWPGKNQSDARLQRFASGKYPGHPLDARRLASPGVIPERWRSRASLSSLPGPARRIQRSPMFNVSRTVLIAIAAIALVLLVLGLATDVGLFGWVLAIILGAYVIAAYVRGQRAA